MNYIDAAYSMYGGDESEIRARSVRVVKVRKEHLCMCPSCHCGHTVKPGDAAVVDRAIVDGAWGAVYTCLPCLESWENHCRTGAEYCTTGPASRGAGPSYPKQEGV